MRTPPNAQKLSHALLKSNNNLTPCANPQVSWALGQLLGIVQRTVEVFLPDFKQRFSVRKLIPAEIKTLGDYLLLKRIKADLSQPELAAKTGFTVREVKAWEHDRGHPDRG